MKWRRDRHIEVPPLEIHGDLTEGERARERAEDALAQTLKDGEGIMARIRAIDLIRQENHLRPVFMEIHRKRA